MTDTPIRITIGDRTFTATLFDNPAANSLRDRLPLDLEFRDYARQEVLADIPEELTMQGMPAGCAPEVGDIGYNHAHRVVVFHYSKIGYFPGTAVLGHMDVDVSIFKGWNGSKAVAVEIAE